MPRRALVGALLVAGGAALASVASWWRAPVAPTVIEAGPAPARPVPAGAFGVVATAGERGPADVARQVELLEASVAQEVAARQRLETRLEDLTARLAALSASARAGEGTNGAAGATADDAPEATPVDDVASPLERALTAAGIDPATALDIKRRRDELTMREMYLRDQATREQWLDAPRFHEEMAAIDAQRTSIRDEIGDAAYDRYLFASGHPNRIRVEDVMLDSPAAQAGLQPGDMIVRYGDTRVFAPEELVAQTRGGTPGDTVRLGILRNDLWMEVEVPRGPLGLGIAATQSAPRAG